MSALHFLAIPAILHISGVAVPTKTVKDVASAASDIGEMIAKQKVDPGRLVEDFVPIGLTAAGITVPAVGIGIAAVVLMIKYSKPPTAADQQRMWDRAQGDR